MRAISVFVLILSCLVVSPAMGQYSSTHERIAPSRRSVSNALPNDLRFERNVGQTDARVAYLARGGRNSVFLTNSEVVLAFGESQSDSLRMRCTGAFPDARLSAEIELPGTVNYLHGGDPESWKRGLPTFARVRHRDIYPGIDVVYSGNQQRLVSEFEISPGADATQIQLQFAGSTGLVVDEQGDLEIAMNGGAIRQRRALVRQIGGVAKQSVAIRYDQVGTDEVTMEVGEYDRTATLVVTVITDFTASLGSASAQDWCEGIVLDATGNIYVTGRTLAHDFPGSTGAAISTYAGQADAFVAKLSPSADTILFASYIGGNYIDSGVDLAVDATGAVYVLGETRSENFVTTPGAYDEVTNGSGGSSDLFVAKFSPAGDTLVYSTLLGGDSSELAGGIAVDASGAVSVCGVTESDDFPVTPGAFDTTRGSGSDAFVTKLNSTGSALVFSTFLGGSDEDEAWDLALNGSGNALVTGRTSSPEYPTTPGAFDRTYSGGDSFVTVLAANGATLSMSTFLGPDSTGQRIALGSGGTIYVAGETDDASFPTTAGAYDRTFNGLQDMFALKLSATGSSLVFSTFVGGAATESLRGLAVDSAGAMHLSGYVDVGGFPTTPGSHDQSFNNGHFDSVAAKLSPTGATLVYGTYLGGAGLDRGYGVAIATNGEAIYVGETEAAGFPRVGGLDLPEDFPNGYVTRLTSTLGTVVFSSFIGGVTGEGGVDTGRAIAVDSGGFIYITGAAAEPNFPTTAGAADSDFGRNFRLKEAYVTKISPGGTSLVYSTFLGGEGDDVGAAIQVDDTGIVTVAGDTCSVDFPETPGAYNPAFGGCDIFAVRLSADGSSVLYATSFGGSSVEYCRGLGIDASGSIFLAGETWSSNFPTVAGAIDTTLGGPIDGFLARISSDGTSLVYGTYVGGMGTDRVNSLAVDGAGVATITGNTGGDFPVTAGAFDPTFNGGGDYGYDGFVARANPQGNQLVYSTYLGGTYDDYLNSVAIDATGAAYVTGRSESSNYPSVGPQPSPPSGASIVTKIAADGASLIYSTRIAGGSEGTAIAVDADGSVATTGYASTFFVTTPGAYQTQLAGQYDAYLVRLHPSGASLEYATLFGGTEYDYGRGIAIGAGGAMYAVGDVVGEGFVPVTFGYGGRNAIFVIAVGAEQIGGATTAGVYLPSTGTWFLKNAHSGGAADQAFSFGPGGAGLVAVNGDWNGNGDDTAGLYDPQSGFFFLKSTNAAGAADLVFGFGPGSAGFLPLAGDWNGDGLDTVGLYDPSTGVFFLKNSNTSGPADVVAGFGPAIAGWVPLVGDWNGDAVDTVGLYSPSNGFFFLRNVNAPGPADLVFGYGAGGAGIVPLVGDWDSDGIDTVGLYAEGTGTFFLRNSNSGGPANFVYGFGPTGVRPLVGDWDGL